MSEDCVGPALKQCPVCGAIGLPERIAVHECATFRQYLRRRSTQTDSASTQEPSDD